MLKKILQIIFLIVLALIPIAIYLGRPTKSVRQTYAVSYADRQAKSLGLDPEETYLAILDELKPRKLRLAAYWDDLQPTPESINFEKLDWKLNQAADRDISVVLTIGRKLPRWPECFYPAWLSHAPLEEENEILIEFMRALVKRYDIHPAVVAWQLENEPFVGWFGDCPDPNPDFLKRELELIRGLSRKPVIITDSGELSTWRRASRFADVFGTTLYRVTWNAYLGYGTYPFPPAIYRLKARLWGLDPNEVVISELQMEPWPPGTPFDLTPVDEQLKSMDIDRFHDQLRFARQTDFKEAWLWGVEWWYWMKTKQDHPEFWQQAKVLFSDDTPVVNIHP